MDVAAVHNESPPDAKITLFRSLFRGARMFTHAGSTIEKWVSLDTRQSAERANEWVRGDCANRSTTGHYVRLERLF